MRHRVNMALLCLVSLGVLQGCGERKQLTPAVAKSMLEEKMKDEKGDVYLLAVSNVRPFVRQNVFENYATGSFGDSDPRGVLQKLIKAGYVDQATSVSNYHNVSGTYRYEGKTIGRWVNELVRCEVTLFMQPGSNRVSGTFKYDSWYGTGQKAVTDSRPLSGAVNQDGTVTLGPEEDVATRQNLRISTDRGMTILSGHLLHFQNGALQGTGPGGIIAVPIYSYSFSNRWRELMDSSGNFIRAGRIEVDGVSDLLLGPTDTMAYGRFTWHVNLNDVARLVAGNNIRQGSGTVRFGKQPDGTWVLTEFSL